MVNDNEYNRIMRFYGKSQYAAQGQHAKYYLSFLSDRIPRKGDTLQMIRRNPVGYKFFSDKNIEYLTNVLSNIRGHKDFQYQLRNEMLRLDQPYADLPKFNYTQLQKVSDRVAWLNRQAIAKMNFNIRVKKNQRSFYKKALRRPQPIGQFNYPKVKGGRYVPAYEGNTFVEPANLGFFTQRKNFGFKNKQIFTYRQSK